MLHSWRKVSGTDWRACSQWGSRCRALVRAFQTESGGESGAEAGSGMTGTIEAIKDVPGWTWAG